jgi:hypothetical protein
MSRQLLRTAASLVFFAAYSAGQALPKLLDFNAHAWFSYSGDHQINGPWGVHFDGQWRRADLGLNWQQFQLRPGLNYRVSDNLLLTLGYAYTRTYPYGEFPVADRMPEHRIYQQVLHRHGLGRARMHHRVRMEQRFIEYPTPQPRSWTYQNRFRYLAKVDIPIRIGPGSAPRWYVPVFNEILIGIPPNYGARPFDQNRLFVGIGRSAGAVNMEVGYMNQLLAQRNGRVFESNNTLFFTVTSTMSLSALWR